MDISNKSVAFLLVVAIVVSLGGTLVSLNKLNQIGFTGFASSNSPSGIANLTVNSSLVLTFVVSNVDFGTGYTNDSTPGLPVEQCVLDTNGTNPTGDCVGFNSDVPPFMLRNDGNADLTVSISADKDAAGFLGGTNPVFQFFVEDNETGSCTTPNPTTWTDMNTTAVDICGTTGFNFEAGTDEVRIHIKVSVPQDADPGAKTTTITATGTDS